MEDDISMDFRSAGCENADWIRIAQDRAQWRVLVTTVTNLQLPYVTANF